jgi:hypothetical protein
MHQKLTTEGRVHARVSQRRICVDKMALGQVFSLSSSVPLPPQYLSTVSLHTHQALWNL